VVSTLTTPSGGRLPALISALAAFCAYVATAYAYPDWLDSPELTTAAFRLSVFHPPGAPLAVLLGHLLSWLPSWDGRFRLVTMSPLFAAGAVYVAARTAQAALAARVPTAARRAAWAGAAFGLVLATTPGLWGQAGRVEVYTLGAWVGLLALREALAIAREPSGANTVLRLRRWAFASGLGLAVHPLMAVACGAAIIPALGRHAGRLLREASLLRILALGIAGGAPLFALPLLATPATDAHWGAIDSIAGWLRFVSGSAFAKTFTTTMASGTDSGIGTVLVCVAAAGLGVTLLGAVALYLVARRAPWLAATYASTLAVAAATLATQRAVFVTNPDAVGYALPFVAAIVLVGAEGLALLLTPASARAAWGGVLAAAALSAAVAVPSLAPLDRSGCRGGIRFAADTLGGLPAGASVLVSDFNLYFMLDYLQTVEGVRDDVSVAFDRENGGGDAPAAGVWRDASPTLVKTTSGGPAPAALERSGLFWRIDATPDAGAARGADSAMPATAHACSTGDPRDERTGMVVAWQSYWSALLTIPRGRKEEARAFVQAARCAAPTDASVMELVKTVELPEAACPAPEAAVPLGAASPASPLRALLLAAGIAAWLGGGLLLRERRALGAIAAGTAVAGGALWVR
jgi:hypothetical protein